MCGIAGLVHKNAEEASLRGEISAMVAKLAHRGPDDRGDWLNGEVGLALGHTRLSILDLSPEGHQPMLSASGRYVMVFNGEVYNFAALARELTDLGHRFRGHSDTEVMLAAFEAWGITAAVPRFNGMFALAVWDRQERVLSLVRDRLGVKPLYYGWTSQGFCFASELKAICALTSFTREIDRNSVALFMRYAYIPAPYAIYRDTYKLMPGTVLSLSLSDLRARPAGFLPAADAAVGSPRAYWSALQVARDGRQQLFGADEQDCITQLDALLRDAIGLRMVADVPLGAFLSGGIDSTTVVALMQAQSTRPVKTFTIGFNEQQFNEASYAKEIAAYLGTDHTELYVTAQDSLALVPRLPQLFDEPFADSSQIPTYLVSQLARSKVTVSLSGDAGDELFGGYERYRSAQAIWHRLGLLPHAVRAMLGRGISAVPARWWDKIFTILFPLLPRRLRFTLPGNKLGKLGRVLQESSSLEVYRQVVSHFADPGALVLGSREPRTALTDCAELAEWDIVDQMMALDLVTYLPDDILTKVDRASMAVSLEAREPLMDYRLVEFAWRLPQNYKLRGTESKWILKQVLYRYVPQKFFKRPKMGFGVPVGAWLRGELRDWAEALLDERVLRQDGYLNPAIVRQKWTEHLSGSHAWEYHLWDLLMFQAWLHES